MKNFVIGAIITGIIIGIIAIATKLAYRGKDGKSRKV